MPRYVRLSAPPASSDDGGPDWTAILRGLAPAGALARVAGSATGNPDFGAVGQGITGAGGLIGGVLGGNPGQAIGGAANLGAAGAGLAGFGDVSAGLSGIAGPLGFGSALASGNYGAAALGLPSAISGGISGAGALAGALGGALPAGLAGLGAIAGSVAPFAAMLLPAVIDTHGNDFFDTLLGQEKSQAQKQHEEFQGYADMFPGLAKRRAAGAGLFDTLGGDLTPEQIQQELGTAASGMYSNPAPAAWNLEHSPTQSHDKPQDLSAWDAASPELGGHNIAAFLNLMDRGEAAGLDTGGIAGQQGAWPGAPTWSLDPASNPGPNTTGAQYRTRLGDPQNSWDIAQTQEAQDLGNSVSGIGAALGLDLNHRQDPSDNNNVKDYGNFNSDQLAGYGLTAGNYGPGVLNYLRSFDPSVTANPEWDSYVKALDPTNALAALDPLTLTARRPNFQIPTAYTPDPSPGGF